MNKQPLVSVLMPLYNSEKYVGASIESILQQTYQNWELLIVNDGSTDNSKNAVLSFQDSRIKYFENEENKGIVYTRNRLMNLAEGDFMANLDSDDIAYPKRLEKQLQYLLNNKECNLCGSWAYKITESNERIGKLQPPVHDEDIYINMLFQFSFVHSTLMMRKSALGASRYNKDYSVAEDYDFVERWNPKAHNLPEYLVGYRCHPENISQEKAELMAERRDSIIRRQLEEFGGDFTKGDVTHLIVIGNLLENNENSKIFKKNLNGTIEKLIQRNRQQKVFNQHRFVAFLWYRWIFYFASQKRWKDALSFYKASLNPAILKHLLPLLYKKGFR
ncbi:glycosyltransferase involved in cell wall biosynthesis [Balneicella halophila]|uniref:Glycosyltransferase involved in cell wall biosynthesis n=1 Tax=Balneicella halophila TaxID=1537566 RepID=A0A7L4UQ11_BALHA|nr:glycosyltransferase family 2 protein [Balneicella halophila]PVX51840.1 glycosyltransferase involved in cell wall biosynthesis [Balneicella halophila]